MIKSNLPAAGFASTLEAARFLRISKSMVNKLVAEGGIPSRRFGRSIRISWSWLKNQQAQ